MASTIIIIVTLLVANGILWYSETCRKKYYKDQIESLRERKIAQGVPEGELTEDDLRDEIEPKQRYSWVLGIVLCLDIWILGAVITHWWAKHFFTEVAEGDSRKALFGDSFGAVNALVSAFAFAGMIVAFVLQRYELRLQRKELRDNRAEMAQQTRQFAAENKNLEIQRFENLFYNMLNLQQKIVDGLRYDYYEEERSTVGVGHEAVTNKHQVRREVVGRDVFRYLFEDVGLPFSPPRHRGYRDYLYEQGLEKYDNTVVPSYFDHYFRHLYKIVQFADSQGFEFDVAYRYISFLRGTLSRYELVWLYYNSLNPGYCNFKYLIEKYSLLKVLRKDLLTLTKESAQRCADLEITEDDLKKNDFEVGDFVFYLTDNTEEKGKYLLNAFWNSKEIDKGKELLKRWRTYSSD